jgi:ABC-type nickel/cobalt efflux system permease component RcnA
MFSVLGLGFLVGMQHAMEADHVAAVSSIAARQSKLQSVVKHGLTWGLGHTITLFLFAGAAIVLGRAIPDTVATRLEAAVGAVLIILGVHVLWRLWRDRIHFHAHRHGDDTTHLHAHSHAGAPLRRDRSHRHEDHDHEHGIRWGSLLVGLMHGMAGSAALIVLAASQVGDPWLGLAYVLVFGFGSMIGMGALSVAIALPLSLTAQFVTWANRGLQLSIGLLTIAIGSWTLYTQFAA